MISKENKLECCHLCSLYLSRKVKKKFRNIETACGIFSQDLKRRWVISGRQEIFLRDWRDNGVNGFCGVNGGFLLIDKNRKWRRRPIAWGQAAPGGNMASPPHSMGVQYGKSAP